MSQAKSTKSANAPRYDTIVHTLADIFARLFGKTASELDPFISLIDMGADSLFLLQSSQAIKERFKMKIPFRLLLEELSTISAIASHIDRNLPEEAPVAVSPEEGLQNMAAEQSHEKAVSEATTQPATVVETFASRTKVINAGAADQEEGPDQRFIREIIGKQLKVMSQQLELLRSPHSVSEEVSFSGSAQTPFTDTESAPANNGKSRAEAGPHTDETPRSEPMISGPGQRDARRKIEPATFVPFEAIKKGPSRSLTERQQKHLDSLISRITSKTPGSKQLTQTYRPNLANGRATAGFRLLWKEILYPLIIKDARGSRIWDVDGNEYVDVTMGFGALLFGHSPSFIIEALQEQSKRGIQLGPHSEVTGKVARLICEMTGVERVAFCNSGTEAVMTALRLARAVTGRDKIALFEGCYHGTFDGVMVRGDLTPDGQLRAIPLAPGVPRHMVENVLLLKYNSADSIRILKDCVGDLAAVLIEPPRSRRPDVQPSAFLHELRQLTASAGTALIFDEIVTGFRFHPGGAQAMFGVQADLVTYGKAIGSGLPVAAVAGKAKYMDAVDGGMWNYGDASYPEADITFFAGTYFQHPLIMPALLASLNHIKTSGPRLHEELDEKTKHIAESLNTYLEQRGIPIQLAHIGSLFRFLHSPELKFMDLFYYHLLDKNIFVCETRSCFLSTAHTDEDVEHIIRAVKETVEEMREGGFLPEATSAVQATAAQSSERLSNDGIAAAGAESDTVAASASLSHGTGPDEFNRAPLTEGQKQIWALAQMDDDGSRAYNQSITLRLRGPLNLQALNNAIQYIVNRHDALRATISLEGDYLEIAPRMTLYTPITDLSHLDAEDGEATLAHWLEKEAQQIFDLVSGPLVNARILKLEAESHVLVITMHHLISDGWSAGIILGELREIYSALCQEKLWSLPQPWQFSQYAKLKADEMQSLDMATHEAYWLDQFSKSGPTLELPTDRPRPPIMTFTGSQQRLLVSKSVSDNLKYLSAKDGCTMFMTLLAAFKVLLYHITGQTDLTIGTPAAGQMTSEVNYLVGYCVNLLPLRSQVSDDISFREYLGQMKNILSDAYDHQDYPFTKLVKKLNLLRDPSRPSLVSVIFNLDRSGPKPNFYDLEVDVITNHNSSSKVDLTFDVTAVEAGLVLDGEYNTSLFSRERVQVWMEQYKQVLENVVDRPDATIGELTAALRQSELDRKAAQEEALKKAEIQKFRSARRKGITGC